VKAKVLLFGSTVKNFRWLRKSPKDGGVPAPADDHKEANSRLRLLSRLLPHSLILRRNQSTRISFTLPPCEFSLWKPRREQGIPLPISTGTIANRAEYHPGLVRFRPFSPILIVSKKGAID
jgi:hypothetical protein